MNRSAVCIKCNEKAYKKLEKAIFSGEWRPDKVKRNNYNDYCIIYNWVKWWSEYEYCQIVEDTLKELDEENEEYFGFLRFGEEDDIEKKWNNYDYLPYLVIDVSDFNGAEIVK